jgi:NAD(P)-dependent dehydrogenase (short-subunit alcohol dehydrogenase family)
MSSRQQLPFLQRETWREVVMTEFRDKVAVVTGAASGIGRSLAERAAREGMKVVLAGINDRNLHAAERALQANGAATLCVRTDVSKQSDVERLARKAVDAFGAVHVLFNNAGVAGGRVSESTIADWEWVVGVNLWGVIYGVHAFLPIMKAQDDDCHIVNMASTSGLVASGSLGTYCVTKYGVVALSEALYRELARARSKIGVSVVCPAYVRTRILDSERNRPGYGSGRSEGRMTEADLDAAYAAIQSRTNSTVISPDAVADRAFEAIRTGKLYVLTHPESKEWVRTRMEDILNERNPGRPPDGRVGSESGVQ